MEESEQLLEIEGLLRASSTQNLAEVVRIIADKIVGSDVREKTELSADEIKILSLLKALSIYWAQEGEKSFAEFLNSLINEFIVLKISHKRRSRAELVRFASKLITRLREEEEDRKEVIKL